MPIKPEREQHKQVATGIERVAALYNDLFPKGKFTVNSQGVFLTEPLITSDHRTTLEEFHTNADYLAYRATLPEAAGAILDVLPGLEFKYQAGKAVNFVTGFAENAVHDVGNWGRSLRRSGGNFYKLAADVTDEVSFEFARITAGDPIEHYNIRQSEGLRDYDHEQHAERLIRGALEYIKNPGKFHGKEGFVQGWVRRIISASETFDKYTDILPTGRAFLHSALDLPVEELVATGAAAIIDMTRIPSPGIDGPSILPYVKASILGKEIVELDTMYQVMTGNAAADGQNDVYKAYSSILLNLRDNDRKTLTRAFRSATELARKISDAEQPLHELSLEDIANSTLADNDKNRLMMAVQLYKSLQIAERDLIKNGRGERR